MSSNDPGQNERNAKLLRKLNIYLRSENLRKTSDPNNHLMRWFDQASLIAATADKGGKMVWRFAVQSEYLNLSGSYSGGAQAAVHDVCTSWTLLIIARPDYWGQQGLSRSLNMSYLTSARKGDILRMETKIVKIGLRTAMIRGKLVRESDGMIVSTCEHHMQNNDGGSSKL